MVQFFWCKATGRFGFYMLATGHSRRGVDNGASVPMLRFAHEYDLSLPDLITSAWGEGKQKQALIQRQ